ncbi:hypothetical protein C5688_09065 [Methylocystis sp. MitZ-2018]|nr:hypothetical protein C5688_09065 [Methylocystis sp. MitZ-2018]
MLGFDGPSMASINDFLDELMTTKLSDDQRRTRLLSAGYFPAELPPPFSTASFAKASRKLLGAISADRAIGFWTTPETFSIPRWAQMRRKLSIVNPINQLMVAHLIATNWEPIAEKLKSTKTSEFHPEIVWRGGRAVTGVNFDGVQRRKTELLSTYGRYVKTDIVRFYSSVYTHSIAWALLGKDWVKSNLKKPAFKDHYAHSLDRAISAGQSGQTTGIPIGPDTSRILSELVASAVEDLARARLPDWDKRCVRYVDDMLLGLHETETPDAVLSPLSHALYDYGLELNGEKTSLHGVGLDHPPEWLHFVKHFQVSARQDGQRDDLDSYFEQAFHLAEANPRENVVRYAVRRSTSFSVAPLNWDHYIRWLLYAVRRSPSCLGIVVEYTSSQFAKGRPLPITEITSFIHQQIQTKTDAAHTYEVCWLLFWARELQVEVEVQALRGVPQLRSSAVALLTLDLRDRGLLNGKIEEAHWKAFCQADGLKSEMWLVAYEAPRKGWWSTPRKTTYIDNHEFFGPVAAENVSFYDSSRIARARSGSDFLKLLLERERGVSSGYEEHSSEEETSSASDEFDIYS